MKKPSNGKLFFALFLGMLVVAVVFLIYAFGHPEGHFILPVEGTWCLYACYLIVLVLLGAAAFIKRKK